MRISLVTILLVLVAGSISGQEISRTAHDFVHQDLTVIEVRTLDPAAGTILREARSPQGVRVDVDELKRREDRLKATFFGNMSPDLFERVRGADATTWIETAFWLNVPAEPEFYLVIERALAQGMTHEDARIVAINTAREFYRLHTMAFAADLVARGFDVTYTGEICPIVVAWVRASAIPAMAADERVNAAYHSAPQWYPENHNAQPTMRTPTVHDRGLTGKNSTIKVMVQDVGQVTTQNPYLPPVTTLNSSSVSSHASSVAGNICSKHSTDFGAAKELPVLYSAGGSGDTNAPKAWATAMQNGVSYGNCSWWNGKKGKIEFLDRYFDYIIRQFGVMMFKSTGNQGNTSTPYTTSPGNGYNMTNSGCFNDGDSWDWTDDAMASYSSYRDPAEGHEKPELASPGDRVATTSYRSPWTTSSFGGTSSASPLTCGVATLLGTADANLRTRTHTLKAVLMASAWQNVEGTAVLSEKDGAGGVHAGAAHRVVSDGQYRDGTLTTSSFPGGQKDIQIQLQANDETRIVALWQSQANSSYSTDVLNMDLDLVILDPSNQTVASSADTKNGFEILAFVPKVTGTYTVRLVRQRFDGTTEPYAVAWSTRQDMATAEIILSGSGAIGTRVNITYKDRYHPGEPYIAAASFFTVPNHVPVPEGHIVPLGGGPLFFASIFGALPGFNPIAVLDGNGQATGTMDIPNDGSLRGIDIYIAMMSFRSGQSGDYVKGTSPAAKFTIQ